eukprot:GFYU01004868.1.p1 GENE.GFYU01004868.1~~GFYU01004868.1.p1  ORF type:complete len:333 (-),score=102.63 GFYU01004868.1:156-1154(-)
MPPKLSLSVSSEPPPMERQDSHSISMNGTLQLGGFKMNAHGIKAAPSQSLVNLGKLDPKDLTYDQKVIGSGASAQVMTATHNPTGIRMAIKIVTVADKEHRDQLLNELNLACVTKCPFTVEFFGGWYQEGQCFLAMELCDAGTLADCLKRKGKIDEGVLALLTFQMMHGLNHLHVERKSVHRDLKPANVLMTSAGILKIADFGISKQLPTGDYQACETFVGTATYMSPERLTGDNYSYPADIFAWGVCLVEMATGVYPYGTPGAFFDLMGAIVNGASPELNPNEFSPEMCNFVAWCLQKDPSQRPPAAALLDHPWINKWKGADIDMAAWVRS